MGPGSQRAPRTTHGHRLHGFKRAPPMTRALLFSELAAPVAGFALSSLSIIGTGARAGHPRSGAARNVIGRLRHVHHRERSLRQDRGWLVRKGIAHPEGVRALGDLAELDPLVDSWPRRHAPSLVDLRNGDANPPVV